MPVWETVQMRHARTGETEARIRENAATGRIPGARRDGGRWWLPVENAETPAIGGGSTVIPTEVIRRDGPNLMSSALDVSRIAWAVSDRVSAVSTRPARALGDLSRAVAAVVAAHPMDRDGRCAADGWSYPCPTARDLTSALESAYSLTFAGVAS